MGQDKKRNNKRYYYALGLVIVALLMTTITFLVLYLNKEPDAIIVTDQTNPVTSVTPAPESSTASPTTPAGITQPNPTTPSETTQPNPTTPVVTAQTQPNVVSVTPVTQTPVVPQVCNTMGCLTAARDLMASINPLANPCEDFYEFACGRWNLTNPIPDDRGRWGVFDVLDLKLDRDLRELLELNNPAGETAAERKAREYYAACMDEETIEEEGIIPLISHILEIFPEATQFPFNQPPTVDDLFAAFTRARKFGLTFGLMTSNFINDPSNLNRYLINFDSATLPIERAFYLKTENRTEIAAYKKYLVDMFVLMAQKLERPYTNEQAEEAADTLIQFETILAGAKLEPEERTPQRIRNMMTIADFAKNFTEPIDIPAEAVVDYFRVAWDNEEINRTLSVDTVVNVAEIEYFSNITEYLTNISRTDEGRRGLGNFVIFSIARNYVSRLGADFRNISRELQRALRGVNAESPRWVTCAAAANTELPGAVGRMYVMQHFQSHTKDKLENMTDYVFDAFKEMLTEADWMTNQTLANAVKKANSFTVRIGYDDYLVENSTQLDSELVEFTTNRVYVTSRISLERVTVKQEALSFLHEVQPTDWITRPAIVNAFYAPTLNSITFPAGILQPPFLGADYPDYWNFGAIGMVIGHEITHGFDNSGSQFDGDGNMVNWWDDESRARFNERADGLVYQYSNFSLMGVQMNGRRTLGENIADNGGIKEAFKAYKAYARAHYGEREEPRLPLFNFTPEQTFFLANAQIWCSDYRLRDLESQVRTGVHSPGRFRILGPMMNFDEFAKAYSCPVGSYMNPIQKNAVW